jgi:quinol-cytochrome oxidoreductase complex cytochrome b subunit
LLFFVFLAVVAFTSETQWIDTHASPLSNATLFLIALVSILIRRPFTLQYARERVDPKFWDSPAFYSTNLVISWVWCVMFAIIAVTSYIALNHPSLIDWVIHILAFVGAIRFTTWYPDYIKKKTKK